MRHAEGLVRREPVVHVRRERLVGALGHEALLVEERQDAGRLRLDQGDAVNSRHISGSTTVPAKSIRGFGGVG